MNYKKLIISLILPQLAGVIGSLFTVSAIPLWYATLHKPSFSPPNWIFGPTWILLYILMGISVYLIWKALETTTDEDKKHYTKTSLWFFWIHLGFNALWSIVFFGLQNPALAFINIIIIWVMILILILRFWKINRWSAYLLIPYLLWVTFASALNFAIWFLN